MLDNFLCPQAFDMARKDVLSCLDCVDSQEFAKDRIDRELDRVLSQEFEYFDVSKLETHVEGILIVWLEFVEMVEW